MVWLIFADYSLNSKQIITNTIIYKLHYLFSFLNKRGCECGGVSGKKFTKMTTDGTTRLLVIHRKFRTTTWKTNHSAIINYQCYSILIINNSVYLIGSHLLRAQHGSFLNKYEFVHMFVMEADINLHIASHSIANETKGKVGSE